MDISISIDAYPVYMSTLKFHEAQQGQGGPFPKDKDAYIPLLKLLLLFGTV